MRTVAARPVDGATLALTAEGYARARLVLMRRDPLLGAAIRRVGPCRIPAGAAEGDHLTALTRALVSQQLSAKAAATIFRRFLELFPGGRIPGAAAIDACGDEALRAVGLSRQKVGYLRDLSARLGDGRLQLDAIETLPDEMVVERLTSVKGFGRWTAEMFLIFRLCRPDVLPVVDLGILTAVQRMYGLRQRPDPKRLQRIGEAWRPYRSVACWYLWQSLSLKP